MQLLAPDNDRPSCNAHRLTNCFNYFAFSIVRVPHMCTYHLVIGTFDLASLNARFLGRSTIAVCWDFCFGNYGFCDRAITTILCRSIWNNCAQRHHNGIQVYIWTSISRRQMPISERHNAKEFDQTATRAYGHLQLATDIVIALNTFFLLNNRIARK